MKNDYPQGIPEILDMIHNQTFDSVLAEKLLDGVDLDAPICDKDGYSTTYLCEAVIENNLPAVAFLLEHGSNPNLNDPDLIHDCPLWELQYLWDTPDWETRYEIAKLFFAHGADPNLESDGESLYDYVLFKVFNDTPLDDNDWENLRHLFLLLAIYGGGGKCYPRPILQDVNMGRVDDYDIVFSPHESGHGLIANVVDGEGNIVGWL